MRIRAECNVNGVWIFVATSSLTSTSPENISGIGQDAERDKRERKFEMASGMIISALGISPLRVVADYDDEPDRRLQLLDASYASNRTMARIEVKTQLYRKSYDCQYMYRYIDEYSSMLSQLESLRTEI